MVPPASIKLTQLAPLEILGDISLKVLPDTAPFRGICVGCAMSQPTARIADEALELLRATHERISNMRVLFNTIMKDLKHGKSHDIEELANLGSFLGYDWANYVRADAEGAGCRGGV
jgi:hypothetical protein